MCGGRIGGIFGSWGVLVMIGSVLDLGLVDRSRSIPMDWIGVGSISGGAFFGIFWLTIFLSGDGVVGGRLVVIVVVVYSPGGVAMNVSSGIVGGAFLGD